MRDKEGTQMTVTTAGAEPQVGDRGLREVGVVRQMETGPRLRKWTRSQDLNFAKF